MRVPLIAGNWKMNTTVDDAALLVRKMRRQLDNIDGVIKVLCPPFISLTVVAELIQDTSIRIGAQNMHFEMKGAYTGEISPQMLVNLCQFIIIGHSERRQYFTETDELVNKKMQAALSTGLSPILCVGERLNEMEEGRTREVVSRQVVSALAGISSPSGLVIAYEPVWAIGTGRAATGGQANATIGLIRRTIAELYDNKIVQSTPILYGGSVTSTNIAEFVVEPEVDGALVGGASLQAEEFVSIVEQTAQIKSSRRS